MLYRRRDIKRMFAYSYSSIEHMGIITFAYGMVGIQGRTFIAVRTSVSAQMRLTL
jgi:formate hydrogenlyase subunit 3/multisubunit Na+/H+ antiporter MnhD subunit